MCIAVPYQVVEVDGNERAWIEVTGARQEVSLQLLPEVAVGDWVLVNLGSVIAKVEEDEAQEIMRLYREIAEVDTLKDSSPQDQE